jgi:tetratricopeptide (TPR) repeat protein
LLFGRAYAAVDQYQYDPAIVDLDAAIVADPDCTQCRHERAYLHAELGNYARAISDLDHEIRLTPQAANAFAERGFARTFNGDLAGAYEDHAKHLELKPDSVGALIARGEAALWLGRFDAADADALLAQSRAKAIRDEKSLARAIELREDIQLLRTPSRGPKAGRCELPQELDASGDKTLIGDCTRAFLDAKTGAAKADALTTRSTAWTVLRSSPNNAAVDLRVAAGLDPGNPLRYINLGYAYLLTSHSWAAAREFDRALAIQKSPQALAGRASARRNLGDLKGAETDALASMELEPNEAAAWLLGDLAFEAGDRESAREFYLAIFRAGSRDDRLLERLKELGVPDPGP